MKPKTKLDRYLMAALGAKTIIPQETTMTNFIVTYSYVTLGVNGATFAENFGYEKLQANTPQEAINKVRRKAPKGSRYFRVRAI